MDNVDIKMSYTFINFRPSILTNIAYHIFNTFNALLKPPLLQSRNKVLHSNLLIIRQDLSALQLRVVLLYTNRYAANIRKWHRIHLTGTSRRMYVCAHKLMQPDTYVLYVVGVAWFLQKNSIRGEKFQFAEQRGTSIGTYDYKYRYLHPSIPDETRAHANQR